MKYIFTVPGRLGVLLAVCQFVNPTPGDWTEQAKVDFEDFGIPLDFEFEGKIK